MTGQTYTHKDLAGLLGVSETTVKSYRRKFPGCVPVANQGKPIRFTAEAAKVAVRIRDLFETGMSVTEVRSRLAAEFDWISEAPPAGDRKSARGDVKDLAPELSHGMSNMAKSLVDMTRQQKAIIDRIGSLEAQLEELGLRSAAQGTGGGPLAEAAAVAGQRDAASREREERVESRLDALDANTRELAHTVHDLSEQLSRFLGNRAKAAEEWKAERASVLESAGKKNPAQEQDVVPNGLPPAPAVEPEEKAPVTAKVYSLRPPQNLTPQPAPPTPEVVGPTEPARQFFSLPLVARNEQGQHLSAGGKSRGRFCLNDLKAMLIYGFTPPNHFKLRWQQHGKGWWLFLEQETSGKSIHLLLMEVPGLKSGPVAEILQIKVNNENTHPVEIGSIIDRIASSEI